MEPKDLSASDVTLPPFPCCHGDDVALLLDQKQHQDCFLVLRGLTFDTFLFFRFRNTPKQYMCVEMLQDGYHRSFSELFTLLSFDLEQRANAPPRSPRLQEPSLGEQREKLETIRLHLCRAEKAERDGSWTIVCEERLHLGRYFTHPMDIWLSFHFYHSCADRVFGGRSKSATEARFHLAELYRQQGDLVEARDHAERALKQAEDGGWLDSEGQPLRLWGCRELGEIYSLLGEAYLAAQEYDTATMLLQLGSKMAIEGEGGEHGAYTNSPVKLFGYLQDVKGLVKSYKAIAKSLERYEHRHHHRRFQS
uniref:Tetratricopeptide repeat protein 29 n=1 Tax=Poecilia mexicana TaxID=48701 RepID=A0A3B3YFL3_9TELE